jgi:hypothetical protein
MLLDFVNFLNDLITEWPGSKLFILTIIQYVKGNFIESLFENSADLEKTLQNLNYNPKLPHVGFKPHL